MNFSKIFTLLLLFSVMAFYACNDNSDAIRKEAAESARVASPQPAAPAATPEPAQNAAGVWHYICSNGCAGGGAKGENCGTCGSPLAHNQAYHDNANGTTTTNPTTPAATPEPAQNAAGVWHYICSNGCAGGGVKGENCGTCGSPLAHNQAYHQ